jgi:hypothetical protein
MSLMNLAGETLCCVCHRVVDPHKAISDGDETPDEEFVAAEVIAHVTDISEVGYCSMRYYHTDCYRAEAEEQNRDDELNFSVEHRRRSTPEPPPTF